jgi:hypothetical protein
MTMAKTVKVTRAQRVAARYLREQARQRGEEVDPRLDVIADAKPISWLALRETDGPLGSTSAESPP